MTKILITDDDEAILTTLGDYLLGEGFTVFTSRGQSDAIAFLEENTCDILLVDIFLSDGSGYEICRAAKEKNIPVIFLTASGDENSVVAGLDMGADDYIAKPFRPRELVSRVRSVLRRNGAGNNTVSLGDVSIDTEKGCVTKNGRTVALSALEYRLLAVFVNNRGKLLSREKLLDEIWDIAGDFVNDNTLTVYIKRLREKIEDDPQKPEIIKTVRGLGYRVD